MLQRTESPRPAVSAGPPALDTSSDEKVNRVIRLAQRLFDVPMVAVTLVNDTHHWHLASLGMSSREIPREEAFCSRTVEQPGPFVVVDASSDEQFKDSPSVTGAPHIRFYAGQPLTAPGGHRVGALCIFDQQPRTITDDDLVLLRDLADLVEQELDSEQELVRASEIQRQLLPEHRPELPGYDIAGQCWPARRLGGDFYDWYPVRDRLQVVVADVMGKGVAAALIAASLRALVRGASRHNDLEEAVNRTAHIIEDDLNETDTFATLFCARLDGPSGRLSYVDAGHGLTGVIRSTGRLRRLLSDGAPIGASFGVRYKAHHTHLAPGDTLVSVSDGFLDYFDSTSAALAAALRINRESADAQELVDRMFQTVGDAPRTDDLTVVAIRRLGSGSGA